MSKEAISVNLHTKRKRRDQASTLPFDIHRQLDESQVLVFPETGPTVMRIAIQGLMPTFILSVAYMILTVDTNCAVVPMN
jgi:hypothetical protein